MKYKYQIIVGRRFPWRPLFNVRRMHEVNGKFYTSGHGTGCNFIEQAMEWIVRDKQNLNKEDTAEVFIVKAN